MARAVLPHEPEFLTVSESRMTEVPVFVLLSGIVSERYRYVYYKVGYRLIVSWTEFGLLSSSLAD
jgi:hypothetical protein